MGLKMVSPEADMLIVFHNQLVSPLKTNSLGDIAGSSMVVCVYNV